MHMKREPGNEGQDGKQNRESADGQEREGGRVGAAGQTERLSTERESIPQRLFFWLTMACFLFFYIYSGNLGRQREEKNLWALAEILLVTAYVFFLKKQRERGRLGRRGYLSAVGLLLLTELYLHRMLLPFFLSGLYFGLLAVLFFLLFYGREGRDCILRGWQKRKAVELPTELLPVLPLLLIQLNRMNIAADYDSLRYGLRSDYVLFNGSFFSSLGQVNTVYSYPKGLEILTAPLATYHSFALLLMFQFWTLLALMLLCYQLARLLSGSRRMAMQAVLGFSMITSFTNMSITAKTDLITLFFQLWMLWFFLRGEWGRGTAAAIFSLSLKPTALIFSGILWATLSLLTLYAARKDRRAEGKELCRGAEGIRSELRKAMPSLLLSALFTGLTVARTLWITGVPFSSPFAGLFQRFGFRIRWPFLLSVSLDKGSGGGASEFITLVLRRLFLFLFCPVGKDMFHVQIAWGGVLLPCLLYAVLRSLGRRRKSASDRLRPHGDGQQEKGARRGCGKREALLLHGSLLSVSAFSVLSLGLLWQVDGNYYLLADALILLTAAELFYAPPRCQRVLLYTAVLLTTVITSWTGAVGFTPIDLVNKGYYDNYHVIEAEQRERGSYEFWKKLGERKENRVLSFAAMPDCYVFPCNVQSSIDVAKSGGNILLYKKLSSFEEFLSWAETDYIYMERSFLSRGDQERSREIIEGLILDGVLTGLQRIDTAEDSFLLGTVDQERLHGILSGEGLSVSAQAEAEEMLRIYEGREAERIAG